MPAWSCRCPAVPRRAERAAYRHLYIFSVPVLRPQGALALRIQRSSAVASWRRGAWFPVARWECWIVPIPAFVVHAGLNRKGSRFLLFLSFGWLCWFWRWGGFGWWPGCVGSMVLVH